MNTHSWTEQLPNGIHADILTKEVNDGKNYGIDAIVTLEGALKFAQTFWGNSIFDALKKFDRYMDGLHSVYGVRE